MYYIGRINLEVFRGGKMNAASIFKKILTNPLIFGALLGIAGVVIGLELPAVMEKPIGQVASSAAPAALMIMGASFHFRSVKDFQTPDI